MCIDNRAFVTRLETCGFTWIHAHTCATVQVHAKYDGSKGGKSVHNRAQLLARTAALLRIYERRRRLQLHFYHFMTTLPLHPVIVVLCYLQKGIGSFFNRSNTVSYKSLLQDLIEDPLFITTSASAAQSKEVAASLLSFSDVSSRRSQSINFGANVNIMFCA